MRIYITDKQEMREITLRIWDNKHNDGWSPDVFGDLEVNLPRANPGADYDADAAVTDAEYREVVEWWEEEIRLYNARECSWFTENLSEDEQEAEFARDLEYGLDAD